MINYQHPKILVTNITQLEKIHLLPTWYPFQICSSDGIKTHGTLIRTNICLVLPQPLPASKYSLIYWHTHLK